MAELTLEPDKRSAQSLAPGIKRLLAQVGWAPVEVELVAVTRGPGSFTGLRVGVTTAKTLAYAAGAEVLGIDTLETIAASAPQHVDTLEVAVDAQRGEVVAGRFARDDQGHFQPVEPARLIEVDAWLASLPSGMTLSGPILQRLVAGTEKNQLRDDLVILPADCWVPTAANVGRLAYRHYLAGRRDDLWTLSPHYSRRSAAEEKWDQRQIS